MDQPISADFFLIQGNCGIILCKWLLVEADIIYAKIFNEKN